MRSFILTFVVGYVIASLLNWGFAEFLLNDWAAPQMDGFMRTGKMAASAASITKLTFGFMVPLLVIATFQELIVKPASWAVRATMIAVLVSAAAFYGTYTFIAGYGNVNWFPLMGFAAADTICMVIGALVIGFLRQWESSQLGPESPR